ncbi:hypothetical protein KI387_019721, partial [Taxus chinensis]
VKTQIGNPVLLRLALLWGAIKRAFIHSVEFWSSRSSDQANCTFLRRLMHLRTYKLLLALPKCTSPIVRIKNNTVMNSLKSKDSWILELSSQQSNSLKETILVSNQMMGSNPPIFVLDDGDDDDDVVVSSSRPFAPARNAVSQQSGRDPIINEEDLELRLGLAGTTGTGRMPVDRGLHHKHFRLPASCTIDLCDEVGENNQNYFK